MKHLLKTVVFALLTATSVIAAPKLIHSHDYELKKEICDQEEFVSEACERFYDANAISKNDFIPAVVNHGL